MMTAFVATGALLWSVRSTNRSRQREALARLAEQRFAWIEDVRTTAADLLSSSAALLLKNEIDEPLMKEVQQKGYRIGLLLGKQESHLELAEAIVSHHGWVADFANGRRRMTSENPFFQLEAELQSKLQHLIEVETELAAKQLRGERIL